MRKVSTLVGLVGLTLVASATTARAQEAASATSAQPAASERRLQLGLSLSSMGLGRFTAAPGGMLMTNDTAFAAGFGLSVSYVVVGGLSVGFAPQATFNVKVKEEDSAEARREYDLMARVAYTFPIVDTIALYLEALPGYSLIVPPDGEVSKGLVFAFGGGAAMDLTDRLSVNLGADYQIGFQKVNVEGRVADAKTKYVRVALGVGMRF